MEFVTKNLVIAQGEANAEDLEKYLEKNLDYSLQFELNGASVSVVVDDENPLYFSDYSPLFLNSLKGYDLGTRELEDKRGNNVNLIDMLRDTNYDLAAVERWLKNNGYFYAKIVAECHGGLTLALEGDLISFYNGWDTGIAGYFVMKKADIRKARGVKKITKKIKEQELDFYRGLIRELNHWLNGNVYYVNIDDEFVERCFGLDEVADVVANYVNANQRKGA